MKKKAINLLSFILCLIFFANTQNPISFNHNHLKVSDDTYENNNEANGIYITQGFYANLQCFDNDYFRFDSWKYLCST